MAVRHLYLLVSALTAHPRLLCLLTVCLSTAVRAGNNIHVDHADPALPVNQTDQVIVEAPLEKDPSCNVGSLNSLAVGETIHLCVFLSSRPTKKMVFAMKVDEYSQLLLKGSENSVKANQSQSTYTWVATSTHAPAWPLNCADSSDVYERSSFASCPQIYSSTERVVQLTNLVVNMRAGKVSSFAWDNGCSGCGPSSCLMGLKGVDVQNRTAGPDVFPEGTCSQELSSCDGNELACDLKLFVSFAGTDRNGRNLASAGLRMSQLTGYTLKSLYEKMKNKYLEVISR